MGGSSYGGVSKNLPKSGQVTRSDRIGSGKNNDEVFFFPQYVPV